MWVKRFEVSLNIDVDPSFETGVSYYLTYFSLAGSKHTAYWDFQI